MGVGFVSMQRIAADGVAWQLPVRCGTMSEDGAYSNDIMGRLSLQRTAAGCSASLGDSGAVHRRKMAQTTTWLDGLMTEAVCVDGATRGCYPGGTYGSVVLMGFLETGQHCSSS